AKPTPFWADAFVGVRGMIIPKHLFAEYSGGKSRDAPANLKPVGTGPYKFVDFKPGDMVRGEINTSYHIANRPHFDTIEMKGGGWHPRKRRQEAENRLPDLHQHAATEEPGNRQAGLPEGRNRHGAQVRDRIGVLLVRCGQSGYLSAFLLRHPDVHHHDDAAG